MIKTIRSGNINFYLGLSTDIKPIEVGLNGSIFYEIDTTKAYVYDEEGKVWREA